MYTGNGSLICSVNYGRLVCLDGITRSFHTLPLPGSERARQYYQIIPADHLSGLYLFQVRISPVCSSVITLFLFQIKYSDLIDGDHVDVEITVFYADFSSASEIGDVDVRILDTYQFQEDLDHEVTYQANIELLKVPEGKSLNFRLE